MCCVISFVRKIKMTQNKMEEEWKDKLREYFTDTWFQIKGRPGSVGKETLCVELELFIRSEKQISYQEGFKKAMEGVKKYWFYAGRWHNAECNFILSDSGVCNCDIKRISSSAVR